MQIKTTAGKVNKALEKMNEEGEVEFDGNDGSFDIKGVEGRFNWNGEDTLTIIIDDKPFFASNSMIENAINKFFK